MKALALTFSGMTDVCAKEIKELIGATCKETKEGVTFEATPAQLLTVSYRAQSITRVIQLVDEGSFDKLTVPETKGTVAFIGKSTTKAQELSERVKADKVYKNAQTTFYLHFENEQYWLGIDLTGDVSKRDYRIFIGRETLTGITGFALLSLADYEPKQVLLDPFCRAGSIVLEAALQALRMSPRHYSKQKIGTSIPDREKLFAAVDEQIIAKSPGQIIALSPQFPSVQATRKNAKIAGVNKAIDFSRTETEWLDIKFEEQSVDCIVTQPPELSKSTKPEKYKKEASLFFERAKAILKKNGKIGLVLRQGTEAHQEAAKTHNFSLKHERTIMQGKEAWKVLIFKQS